MFDNINYSKKVNEKGLNIQILVVNPELVRRGIATKMMSDFISNNKKYDVFKVHVDKENVACKNLLSKLGFKIEGKMRRKDKSCVYKLDTRELIKNRK